MNKIINIVSAKQSVFYFFLAILFLPLFQFYLPFTKEAKLNGVEPAQALPEFSIATWITGDYQKSYEPEFEKNIGFHNSLVRLHNQIYYSVYGISNAEDVIVGKNEHLFLKNYVHAYTGEDFVGAEYINIQCEKTKLVQAELKKRGIAFFVVLAPGKGSFYSEYIPNHIKVIANTDSTNYICYKNIFTKFNINVLDLRSRFATIKDSVNYPLFINTGVHWTEYGAYMAGLEMVKYIEALAKIDLPDIKLESLEQLSLSGNQNNDYDVANLMNVFVTIPHSQVAIPKLRFETSSSKKRPRFLCISDSYFPGIVNTDIPKNVFTDCHYWLYNDGVFPESFLKATKRNKKQLKSDIEKQEVICIMATDAMLKQFPFGFIDEAYELYAQKDSTYFALKEKEFRCSISKTIENINGNKDWKNQQIESAKAKKIPAVDEFFKNALWIYQQEQLKMKND